MVDFMDSLVPILAIIMSLGIPIVIIVAITEIATNRKNREKEVKQLIIENNIDMERAKLLLEEKKDSAQSPYATLRCGCALVGIGIGCLINHFWLKMPNPEFWIVIASFMGLGFLVAFTIEYHLEKKKSHQQAEEE